MNSKVSSFSFSSTSFQVVLLLLVLAAAFPRNVVAVRGRFHTSSSNTNNSHDNENQKEEEEVQGGLDYDDYHEDHRNLQRTGSVANMARPGHYYDGGPRMNMMTTTWQPMPSSPGGGIFAMPMKTMKIQKMSLMKTTMVKTMAMMNGNNHMMTMTGTMVST